ncbi:hypothetical protein GH714_015771 [Hevea brasiliensis]|uniref:DUF4283 domain-containing protein n=1 Tax=Hevea brasiliensis TaxID=3981 RepID=A0A6A6KUF7_HEVBR|nr:hypothetical protein GH714_015771 [Hevea brasiliensis]
MWPFSFENEALPPDDAGDRVTKKFKHWDPVGDALDVNMESTTTFGDNVLKGIGEEGGIFCYLGVNVSNEDMMIDKSGVISMVKLLILIDKGWKSDEMFCCVGLWGKKPGFCALSNRVKFYWNRGLTRVHNIENNHYLVQFSSEEDYQSALLDRPWTLFSSYLIVQPWCPKFDVNNLRIDSTVILLNMKASIIRVSFVAKHQETFCSKKMDTMAKNRTVESHANGETKDNEEAAF